MRGVKTRFRAFAAVCRRARTFSPAMVIRFERFREAEVGELDDKGQRGRSGSPGQGMSVTRYISCMPARRAWGSVAAPSLVRTENNRAPLHFTNRGNRFRHRASGARAAPESRTENFLFDACPVGIARRDQALVLIAEFREPVQVAVP